MRRSTQFLTGLAAAAITFATLSFTLGPRHYAYRGHHSYGYGHHRHHERCGEEKKPGVAQDSTQNTY